MVHRAVCPGSFDPITMGHVDIFRRAAQQFDDMVVLVTGNPNKPSGLFSISERVELAEKAVADLPNVTVDWWGGLLVDYTTKHDIGVIVKGLRSALDYEYEVPMAQMNRSLSGVDTMFFMTNPKYGHVSSTLCKEVIKYGGDIHDVLPPDVEEASQKSFTALQIQHLLNYGGGMSARTTAAVEVADLHITRAKNHILHGLTFTLDKGSITGLLGPSGCGKTTLIRAIVGSQRITSGTITILGQPAGSAQLRTTVACATQNLSIYRDLTVMANITYFARLYGATDYDNVLETVGLADYRTTLVENLSGGQASRVSLACALVAHPQVLILDEPTVGLDPVTRKSLWEVFRQLADTGITIMVSSHVLDEANHCDNVILMRRGRILAHAPNPEAAFLAYIANNS